MKRAGFTLVELAAVIATGVTVGSAGLIAWQPAGKQPPGKKPSGNSSLTPRQRKDEVQLRGVHQAMVVWAQNNQDKYPLPSKLDKADTTVSDKGRAKDTTANIYSIMIYNGSLSTEIFVSPAEASPNVAVQQDYDFKHPKKAVQPDKALWDPSFAVEFGAAKKANASYAHLQPAGERMKRWSNTFNASEMIVADRGPEVKSVEQGADGSVTPTLASPGSNALKMHGVNGSWSGFRCFNDDSVSFAKDVLKSGKPMPMGQEGTYTGADGKKRVDVWCHDEADDAAGANTFLGLFTKAGASPKDYRATWD
jgi:hypothetical protein